MIKHHHRHQHHTLTIHWFYIRFFMFIWWWWECLIQWDIIIVHSIGLPLVIAIPIIINPSFCQHQFLSLIQLMNIEIEHQFIEFHWTSIELNWHHYYLTHCIRITSPLSWWWSASCSSIMYEWNKLYYDVWWENQVWWGNQIWWGNQVNYFLNFKFVFLILKFTFTFTFTFLKKFFFISYQILFQIDFKYENLI